MILNAIFHALISPIMHIMVGVKKSGLLLDVHCVTCTCDVNDSDQVKVDLKPS